MLHLRFYFQSPLWLLYLRIHFASLLRPSNMQRPSILARLRLTTSRLLVILPMRGELVTVPLVLAGPLRPLIPVLLLLLEWILLRRRRQ